MLTQSKGYFSVMVNCVSKVLPRAKIRKDQDLKSVECNSFHEVS